MQHYVMHCGVVYYHSPSGISAGPALATLGPKPSARLCCSQAPKQRPCCATRAHSGTAGPAKALALRAVPAPPSAQGRNPPYASPDPRRPSLKVGPALRYACALATLVWPSAMCTTCTSLRSRTRPPSFQLEVVVLLIM